MASKLGKLLRERRQRVGISLRELARRIEKSPTYLVSLERAEAPPGATEETLAALAKNLELEIDEVLTAAGKTPLAVVPQTRTELALYRIIRRLSPKRQEELRSQLEGEMTGDNRPEEDHDHV